MRKLISLFAGLMLSFFAQAQTNAIHHMDVFIQTHFTQINQGDTAITTEVQKEPQMFIELSDTNDITSFTVKLGSTSGGNDIIEKTFTFNEEGEFQDGTSYSRDGIYVRLYLGKYATLPNYYAQVRATVGGSQQSAVTFSGQ